MSRRYLATLALLSVLLHGAMAVPRFEYPRPLQQQGTQQREMSLVDIDALMARSATLVFNTVEPVIEEDEVEPTAARPYSSEPDLKHQNDGEAAELMPKWRQDAEQLARRQAKREEVSARLVGRYNAELNGHAVQSSPSPSPNSRSEGHSSTVILMQRPLDDLTVKLPQAIPFDLELFGRRFPGSDIFVSSNGYVRLTNEGFTSNDLSAASQALPLPADTLGSYMLFPYWDDLTLPVHKSEKPYPYSVSYRFTDESVTFDWRVVPFGIDALADDTTKGLAHFQLIYTQKAPQVVEFVYGLESDPEQMTGEYATIGVQAGTTAFQYANFQEGSVKPGSRLAINTVTGEVDVKS